MTTEYAHILPRRGTAAVWTSVNPVLLMGEEGLETDTGLMKRGDEVTAWNSLAYTGGGGGGSVTSVAGRTGVVVLANTDISGLGNAATRDVGTTTGTAAAGDDLRFGGGGGAVTSVAGRTGAVVLTSTDVGLASVNNTTDAAKPVSTAQAAAIAAVTTTSISAATTGALATEVTTARNASNLTSGTVADARLPDPYPLGSAENPVTDPAASRPTGIPSVYWVTDTEPTNATAGDVISLPTPVGTGSFFGNIGLCATVDSRALNGTNKVFSGANRALYIRVMGSKTGATKYRITVGVQSGNISFACFANTGTGITAAPTGTAKGATGAVTCPAAGTATFTVSSFNVSEGDWVGFSCDNTTAAFQSGVSVGTVEQFAGLVLAQNTAHPVPSTPGSTFGSSLPLYVGIE